MGQNITGLAKAIGDDSGESIFAWINLSQMISPELNDVSNT